MQFSCMHSKCRNWCFAFVIVMRMNLLFRSSFPEYSSDDGDLCEARALHAAAGHCVRDVGLRNLPEVPALSQKRDRLCLRHAVYLSTSCAACTTTLARPPNCSCLPQSTSLNESRDACNAPTSHATRGLHVTCYEYSFH